MSDNLKFATDSLHYVAAANIMIEMEAHREALRKSKELSDKVNAMGYGDSIRTTIADYAGIRDDVRASKAEKRKRNDVGDVRNDYVQTYVDDHYYDRLYAETGMTLTYHGAHRPNFVLHNIDIINELKLKKRKHENDPGFRGY